MHGEACFSQPIGDLWLDGVFVFAPDQPIALQLSQAGCQYLGRDARDLAAQDAEAAGLLLAQHIDHMGFPLTPKLAQQRVSRTGHVNFDRIGRGKHIFWGSFHLVTTFTW